MREDLSNLAGTFAAPPADQLESACNRLRRQQPQLRRARSNASSSWSRRRRPAQDRSASACAIGAMDAVDHERRVRRRDPVRWIDDGLERSLRRLHLDRGGRSGARLATRPSVDRDRRERDVQPAGVTAAVACDALRSQSAPQLRSPSVPSVAPHRPGTPTAPTRQSRPSATAPSIMRGVTPIRRIWARVTRSIVIGGEVAGPLASARASNVLPRRDRRGSGEDTRTVREGCDRAASHPSHVASTTAQVVELTEVERHLTRRYDPAGKPAESGAQGSGLRAVRRGEPGRCSLLRGVRRTLGPHAAPAARPSSARPPSSATSAARRSGMPRLRRRRRPTPPSAATRKTVTALFADLVGSTCSANGPTPRSPGR